MILWVILSYISWSKRTLCLSLTKGASIPQFEWLSTSSSRLSLSFSLSSIRGHKILTQAKVSARLFKFMRGMSCQCRIFAWVRTKTLIHLHWKQDWKYFQNSREYLILQVFFNFGILVWIGTSEYVGIWILGTVNTYIYPTKQQHLQIQVLQIIFPKTIFNTYVLF